MNLGDFKTLLRDAIKRGNSYDEQLDGFTRRAARFIEQNYTLQYMRRRFTLRSVAGEDKIELPTQFPIKSIEAIRFVGADGTLYPMAKGDLMDPIQPRSIDRYGAIIWQSGSVLPSQFFMDGMYAMVFDKAFPEALDGQGMMARYSDFPKQDNQTHWLIQNAEGLMLRQCLIEFFTLARDDRGYSVAKLQREEDIKALLNADFEARHTGSDLQW